MSYPPRRDLESQNDEQLDTLHSKLKALRAVTSEIHADSQHQNTILDSTTSTFDYVKNSLSSSSLQLTRTITANKSPSRLAFTLVLIVLGLYLVYRLFHA